jgi:hypothetical protein
MNKYWGYIIQAYWGPRRETPEQLGLRFMRMIDALATTDRLFRDWEFFGATQFWPMPPRPNDQLTHLIADCIARAEDGDSIPISGYQFGARTRAGSRRPRDGRHRGPT